MAYNGSIDLINGLRPKNNGTFPLVAAKDVYVDDVTRLDTKLQQLGSSAAVAPTEATNTASMAHAVGDYFILGDTLYVATVAIAVGAEIVTSGSETNCRAAVLGNEISAVKSAISANDTLINFTDSLVNYDYDEPADLAPVPSSAAATRLGVKREGPMVILNGNSNYSETSAARIRLNGVVSRRINDFYQYWDDGLSLNTGHLYKVSLRSISGTATARPTLAVYPVNTTASKAPSSVVTVLRSDETSIDSVFTAQEGITYNFALFIEKGRTYTDAKYLVTMQDVTAEDLHSGRVPFDRAIELTDEEKATARANIGIDDTSVHSEINTVVYDSFRKELQTPTWSQGGIASATGAPNNTSGTRIKTTIMRGSCDGLLVYLPDGMKAAAFAYVNTLEQASYVGLIRAASSPDNNGAWYAPVTQGLAYAVILGYEDDSSITPNAAANVQIYKCYAPNRMYDDAALNMGLGDQSYIDGTAFVWENGGFNTNSGAPVAWSYTIRTAEYIPVYPGRVLSYVGDYTDSTVLTVYFYDASKQYKFRDSMVSMVDSEMLIKPVTVPDGVAFIKISYGNASASGIKVTDGKDLINSISLLVKNKKTFDDYLNSIGLLRFGMQKGYWKDNGQVETNTTGICSDTVLKMRVGSIVSVVISEPGWVYSIKQGDTATSLSYTDRTVSYSEFSVSKEYVSITLYKRDDNDVNIDLQPQDFTGQVLFFVSGYETAREVKIHDIPENIGVLNVINRAYQMAKLTYTPIANLPTQVNTSTFPHYIPAGKKVEGVMYSSVRAEGLHVPQCVSLHTYMTALLNQNSYIYTRMEPEPHYNALTYYGAVCSSFVAWCYGIDSVVPTTHSFDTYDGMAPIENQSPYGLKLGDSLNKANTGTASGHIVIVTDIIRNSRGIISAIEITEQTNIGSHPMTRHQYLTPAQIQSTYFNSNYIAYRYHYIYKVPYTPSPWINLDDENAEPMYNPNLSPRRGEDANWRPGEDVVIDVTDAADYTQAKLYKGTAITPLRTDSIPATNIITYQGLEHGRYKVCLTNGTTDSEYVYFDIIGTAETFTPIGSRQVTVAFSSTEGTPASINVCEANSNDSDYKAVVAFHVLTDAEISAGEATITTEAAKTYLMKVMYKTPFGLYSGDLTSVTVVQ